MTIKEGDKVEIKDDYGNTVKMELSQAKLIGEALKKVKPSKS